MIEVFRKWEDQNKITYHQGDGLPPSRWVEQNHFRIIIYDVIILKAGARKTDGLALSWWQIKKRLICLFLLKYNVL